MRTTLVPAALVAAFAINSSGCEAPAEPEESRDAALERIGEHTVGLGYADSSINVSVFRESAVLRVGARVMVAYYDPEGFARVDVLDDTLTPTGWFRITPHIEDRLLGDGHCMISMGATPAGDLAMVFGSHAAGSVTYQAMIDAGSLQSPPSGAEIAASVWPHTITYPQFYRLGDTLRLYFRKDAEPGGAAEADLATATWDAGEGVLSPSFDRLLPAGDDASVYMERMAVDGDRAALTWMYRKPTIAQEQPPAVRNEGMYLALTSDGGASWTDRSSNPLELPAPKRAELMAWEVPLEDRPINQTSTAFGPGDLLYDAQLHLDDAGIYQIFVAGLDLATGIAHEDVVSTNGEAFDLAGAGTLVLPLSRPDLAVSADYVHVVYRQHDAIVVASRAHDESEWRTSSYAVADLGAWEPNFDPITWETRRELLLFVQPVRQGAVDQADVGEPSAITLWRFAESAE